MKKTFVEPDVKVIKFNLNENIAASGILKDMDSQGLSFYIKEESYTIINTGVTMERAAAYLDSDDDTTSTFMTKGQAALVRDLNSYFGQNFNECSAM